MPRLKSQNSREPVTCLKMVKSFLIIFITCFLILPASVGARGGHGSGARSSHSRSTSSRSVSVKSYHSKSGKSVKPYKRSVPSSNSRLHHGVSKSRVPKASSGTNKGVKEKVVGVTREKNGKIARSSKAKNDFMKQTGYPNGRPGYVVDHKVSLKHGGADSPSNMQWQTKAEAKAKDKIE